MSKRYIKTEDEYIPVADTQGIVRTTSYMVPDYAKMETVNRITENNGTWTADRLGYVFLYGSVGVTTGSTSYVPHVQFFINGKKVSHVVSSGQGAINASMTYGATHAVKPGDVVKIYLQQDASTSITPFFTTSCYFIPPLYVTPPVPVVEYGQDYSLAEQPVMVNDGTQIRQKKDYDGRLVWERTFVGNVVVGADTPINTVLISGGIQSVLPESDGWWQPGAVDKLAVSSSGPNTSSGFNLHPSVNDRLVLYTRTINAREGTTNNAYRVTVRYTKIE
jgi:hypothetical protein